jgi:hypothetical protein
MIKVTRVENGPTGAVVWHLSEPDLVIFWPGPGGRLSTGFNTPGSRLHQIEHRTADGEYATRKQADAAVRAFLAAIPAMSADDK